MTLYGADGSHHDAALTVSPAGWDAISFMLWRASIGHTADETYWTWREQARLHNKPFCAYHFVYPTKRVLNGVLVYTAEIQAATFASVEPDRTVPVMLDWESDSHLFPTFDDVLAVAEAIRALGYWVPLLYTGKWYWEETGMPDLTGHDFDLAVAQYRGDSKVPEIDNYSKFEAAPRYGDMGGDTSSVWDTGVGGLTPVMWQFSSRVHWGTRYGEHDAIREPADLRRWFKVWDDGGVSAPRTTVTVPTFLKDKPNGKLDTAWLRPPDAHTADVWKMFVPVSYAMQAMILAAAAAGHTLGSTGRYRTYERQVVLFLERYSPIPIPGRPTKVWNGQTYWQKPGVAMAATPGTSNHGLGLADDLTWDSADAFRWLDDNQASFDFGLETPVEQWHRHWLGGDALNQLVVDVLYAHGITVPDMTEYGFYVPDPTKSPDPPTPPKEDDMAIFLAYTDTTSTGGQKQLWRGNLTEAYSLGDPNKPGTDAYGLVRRNFATDVRVKGVYTNPNTRKAYETADEIVTISPNQVRLDLGTPRSASI